MQLTNFTDYALRVLISVAAKPDRELSTIGEIAGQYGISRNHLTKVVHHLSRSGYLATTRGKNGGFRLARPAERIRIGDVIRDTEGCLAPVPCLRPAQPSSGCAIEPACVLKRALREAARAFLAVTDGYTLADLTAPGTRLRALLGTPT